MNAATDNPLVLRRRRRQLGQLPRAADRARRRPRRGALAEVGSIAERRLDC
jgi:hypothetical protein